MKMISLCLIAIFCICSSFAEGHSSIEQNTTLNLDSVVRSKDANGAVNLLEHIEQQDFLYFNIVGGPFDADQELFSTVRLCSGFLSENTLDSRWGNLARIPADDIESIAQMLISKNVGERTLALFKLQESGYRGGLEDELFAIGQDDPLVYFAYERRGMRMPPGGMRDDSPNYGKFKAPLRSMARAVSEKQGLDLEPIEAFEECYERFGVERLIEYFASGEPDAIGGVLYNFYKMDPDSYGAKYLSSLEHHEKIPDEHLDLLKQHLNKKMRMPGRVYPKDLARALEEGEKSVFAVKITPQASVTEEAENTVSEKKNAPLTQEKPIPETNIVVAQSNNTSMEPAPQTAEETTSNPWMFVFPIIGVLLVVFFAVFKSKKR